MAYMERREQMRQFLSRRDRLGLTFRALSEETGIAIGTLASWAWKLRQEGSQRERCSAPSRGFVEIVPGPELVQSDAVGGIEILLTSGRRVVVHDGFDEDRLVRVVKALERC